MARAPARARAEFENYIDSVQLIGTNGSSTNAKQPYNTVEQLRYYWTAEKIKQALNVPSYISHHISAIQERYPRVFSVLVLLEKAEFIQDLISEPNFEDPHLPFFFSRQHPPHRWPFGKEEFSRFYNLQWRFSVRDLDSNRLMSGPNFDKEIILPFIKSEPLKPGDSAATCKVEVDTAHNRITTQASNNRPANAIDLASRPTNAPEIQFKNVTTNCFVLKTYRTNKAKKYYEKEVSAFGRLMHPDRYVENIITFYGSWIHGDTYNILLEYADRRTLLDYYRNVHPPTRIEDITQFWTRLFDTVKALHCIHQLHDSGLDGPTVLQGIHQDIKPQNILVCSGGSGSDYDVIFKIADLGLSHFNATVKIGQQAGGRDGYGTPMYSAPECCRLDGFLQRTQIPVTAAIDVWSLGCCFSEAATWAVLGTKGLEDYEDLRRSELSPELHRNGYDGCFHNGQDVLLAVKSMHKRLAQERRISDLFIDGVCDTVEMMLESNQHARWTALQVFKRCKQMVHKAENLKFPQPFRTVSDPVPHGSPYHRQTKSSVYSPSLSSQPKTPPQVPGRFTPPSFNDNRHATPPQSPIGLPGVSNSHYSLHRPLSVTGTSDLQTIPQDLNNAGLYIGQSPNPHQHPVMNDQAETDYWPSSSYSDQRPFNNRSREATSSKVSFATERSTTSAFRRQGRSVTQHYPPIDEHFDPSPYTPIPRQFVLGRNGSVTSVPATVRPTSLAETEARSENKKVTIKAAIQWKKGRMNSSNPIDSHIGRLEGRDHAFLIDNSASMKKHWTEVVNVFKGLANIVHNVDPDGIDIYFTNSSDVYHRKRMGWDRNNWQKLIPKIQQRQLAGTCDMKVALQSVLSDFSANLDPPTEKPRNGNRISRFLSPLSSTQAKPKKGLSVYVLTDGIWQDSPPPVCGVEQPIRHVVEKLDQNSHLDAMVGIQFIRFGEDPRGRDRMDLLDSKPSLQKLDSRITMDIVDTTKSDGDVMKMLFGAWDRHMDGDEQHMPNRTPSQRSVAHSARSLSGLGADTSTR